MHLTDAEFLRRTLDLAQRGGTATAPNPQVGALFAHEGQILAEGWHQRYGGPHAEVHCLAQLPERSPVLAQGTLYVSLEPCSHHGKTPPCADLILARGIRRVVVGCPDPNPRVQGQGIARLQAAGVTVLLADDPTPYQALIRPFRTGILHQRPHITLKWAQTPAGVVGSRTARLHLSGPEALRYGHRLRATHAAVLVGATTALADDPALTLRHYPGTHPLRLVIDRQGRLPGHLQVLTDGLAPTWVLTDRPQATAAPHLHYLTPPDWSLGPLLTWLYTHQKIGSLLVEGGPATHRQFLEAGLWDDLALLVRHTPLPSPPAPVYAPALPAGLAPSGGHTWPTDRLVLYHNPA
ncbi:MAG: bifunctional diaminohydroxyphosphoribosylaminopyrimidine deaminase/5-amino-6-(5-phosphoribosylamino)uracil reductase RibD [Bacteroidia bacterium]|nr:bifunctional diaminohydroxyphosphoribosylaminopyrimidine deaminase/5-amino-6-(5-phosphoribosylamino)uracil reductase RibD [Bacteroidia bacterium]